MQYLFVYVFLSTFYNLKKIIADLDICCTFVKY